MSHKLNRSLEEVKQFNPIQNGLFRGCSRMEGYDVIISVHDITDKFISRDSNYIMDVVM